VEDNMITKNEIEKVIKAIVEGYHPQKIILFGFYANGNPTQDSDLDLLVVKNDNLPKIKRNRVVRGYLKDFLFPIDIIVKNSDEVEKYKDIIGTVIYSANKYGKVVYGKE
jgi:predicted nucleotidyltransferase